MTPVIIFSVFMIALLVFSPFLTLIETGYCEENMNVWKIFFHRSGSVSHRLVYQDEKGKEVVLYCLFGLFTHILPVRNPLLF